MNILSVWTCDHCLDVSVRILGDMRHDECGWTFGCHTSQSGCRLQLLPSQADRRYGRKFSDLI